MSLEWIFEIYVVSYFEQNPSIGYAFDGYNEMPSIIELYYFGLKNPMNIVKAIAVSVLLFFAATTITILVKKVKKNRNIAN